MAALEHHDLATAQRLYEREAAGRAPVDVWRAAAEHRRHDLLLAVLVLHRQQGIERTLWEAKRDGSLNGELHRVLQEDFAASLRSEVKQLPYYSEKPQRVTTRNLNDLVPFADAPIADERIACRHLALLWVLQLEASGKPDYAAFGDEASIRQNIGFAADGLYDRLQQTAPTRLVPLEHWGAFMTAQLASIETNPGTASKRFLIRSTNHAMALELKVKHTPAGPRYVANFYDPNVTAAHKRIASDSLQRFEALTPRDLLSTDRRMDLYFRQAGEKVAAFVEMPPDGIEALAAPEPGGSPHRRIEGLLPPPDSDVIYHLMLADATSSLRDLAPAFAQLAHDDPERAADALEARASDGPTALCQAMSQGLAHTIRAYGDLMDLVDLHPDYRAELLASRQNDGTPALLLAMQHGHASAVRTFFNLVAESNLPWEAQVDLLTARAPDGDTGLMMALDQRESEAVRAYLDGMAAHPDLGTDGKAALLTAPGPAGATALGYGLKFGGPDISATLVRWIVGQEDFDANIRCDLLLARDTEGTPGLVHAFRRNVAETIAAFVQGVLASPMDDMDKVHVLLAGSSPGTLLRHAQEHEAWESVAAYREAVLAARPAPAVELMLLSEIPRRPRT